MSINCKDRNYNESKLAFLKELDELIESGTFEFSTLAKRYYCYLRYLSSTKVKQSTQMTPLAEKILKFLYEDTSEEKTNYTISDISKGIGQAQKFMGDTLKFLTEKGLTETVYLNDKRTVESTHERNPYYRITDKGKNYYESKSNKN